MANLKKQSQFYAENARKGVAGRKRFWTNGVNTGKLFAAKELIAA